MGERRFLVLLVGSFAALAVFLAAVGIHGLLSYRVSEQQREIGIRVALGASVRRVMAGVVWDGLALVAAGLAIGLAGAVALTRLLAGLLFGVTPTDAATFLAVPVCVTLVALAASLAPAWRAVRVDPVRAIRGE